MSDPNPFYGKTFAERLALRQSLETKQVDADDDAVETARKPAKRATSKAKKS